MLIIESLLGVVVALWSTYICVYLINNRIKAVVVRGSNLDVMKGKMLVLVSQITKIVVCGVNTEQTNLFLGDNRFEDTSRQ